LICRAITRARANLPAPASIGRHRLAGSRERPQYEVTDRETVQFLSKFPHIEIEYLCGHIRMIAQSSKSLSKFPLQDSTRMKSLH
jgi:hypothetical protein